MQNNNLKVFILEDLKTDAELIKRQVLKFNPDSVFTIATKKQEFLEKIEWLLPDIILSDYQLPDFDGLQALHICKEKFPNIPYVFVTGTLNNEIKVAQTILKGADGYVMKNDLDRLQIVLKRVIRQYQDLILEEKEKAKNNRMKSLLFEKLEAKVTQLQPDHLKKEVLDIIRDLKAMK